MRILNRYILKNVVAGYVFILLIFAGLYFIIDLFSTLSDILKTKPSLDIILSYYFHMLPLIFLRVAPFSLLMSALYGFGELNKNNEIVSMRASGIGIFKICLPVISFALLMSVISLYIQEKILVVSQKKVEEIKTECIDSPDSDNTENNFAFPSENMLFFVRKFSPREGIMENATVFEENNRGNIVKKSLIDSITYNDGVWQGKNIIEYSLDEEGNIAAVPMHWLEKTINLKDNPQELTSKRSIFSQFTPLRSLGKEIARLKKINTRTTLINNLTIDYHRKIADAFAHLFLLIAALPFALEIKKRRVAISSLGTGFIFSFTYYCFTSFSIALGKSGSILPVFSAWLAPIFFLSVGIAGLMLVK